MAAGATMEDAVKAGAEASRLGSEAREAGVDGPALEAVRQVEAAVKAYDDLSNNRDADRTMKGAIDQAAKEAGASPDPLPATPPLATPDGAAKAAELMRAADAAVAGLN